MTRGSRNEQRNSKSLERRRQSESPQETFNLPASALEGDVAILGRKGGGKTVTAKGIVENLLRLKRRVLILDPLGGWYGLRTSADGEEAGFSIAIFGGEHGDMPLDPAAAIPMARIVAKENLPAIIDLSDLSKYKQAQFMCVFLHELRTVNRDPLTIVLEEADVFAPQNPMGDDSKELLGEIDWIARRGRARGFRLVTITQRPARLAKDVLTQCSTLIAHRLPAPQDRDAVRAWVDGNGDRDLAKEVFATLANLDRGEAWLWSTTQEWPFLGRVRFPMIETLDTTATPKAGERLIEPKVLADVDVGPIKAALEAAKTDGKKPVKPASLSIMPELEVEHRRTLQAEYQRGWKEGELSGWQKAVGIAGDHVRSHLLELADGLQSFFETMGPPSTGAAPPGAPTPVSRSAPAQKPGFSAPRTGRQPVDGVPGAAAKMLAVLDTNPPVFRTWSQVATLAGLKARGGHFNTGKKWLVDSGKLIEDGPSVRIAIPSAGSLAPVRDPAALVDQWCRVLSARAPDILRHLFSMRSKLDTVENIGAALNVQTRGGHWNTSVKELRSNEIVTVSGNTFTLTDLFR
jgi:uncharacterized protein